MNEEWREVIAVAHRNTDCLLQNVFGVERGFFLFECESMTYIYIFSFQISKYSTESLILKKFLQFMDCDLQYFGNLDNASRRKVFWINMKIQLSNLFHKSFYSFHAWPFYANKDFLNEICEIFVVFK
jgi:hypothetical protein